MALWLLFTPLYCGYYYYYKWLITPLWLLFIMAWREPFGTNLFRSRTSKMVLLGEALFETTGVEHHWCYTTKIKIQPDTLAVNKSSI